MDLRIKKISLENFKGIKNKEIVLDGKNALIKGCNGAGKSTVGSALAFVISSADLELNKDPMVTPLGQSECTTRVEIELSVDGKPLTIAKIQKYKEKVDEDGRVASSANNSYEINSVAKSQRDFIEELNNRGINTEDFMVLTNPNAFTADTSKKGREQMREILFEMADNFTDIDIAKEVKAKEVVALLEDGYKLDEIEASAKATIKRINDANGKDNQIINSRIQGILDSKSTLNAEELERTREEYETELVSVRAKAGLILDEDNATKAEIARLEGELIEIEERERKKLYEKIDKKVHSLMESQKDANAKKSDMIATKGSMDHTFAQMDGVKESLENYRSLYKRVQDEAFDESSTVCPTCGRSYDKSDVDEMKAKFEKSKTERLADYKKKGETYSKQLKKLEKEYEENKVAYEAAEKEWKAADAKVDKLDAENNAISRVPDLSKVSAYTDTENKIKELRTVLQAKGDLELQGLSSKEAYLIQMIKQVDGELAVVERNKDLDKQVAELRESRKNDEITKAKKEHLLYLVEEIHKRKDDKLAESINKNFSLVNWKFWEYQRNGERKSICEPYIDNKPMSTCANGSLRTLAKISICSDIQRSMGIVYPIICDDYTLFSSNSTSRINVGDSQLIGLVVTEDKELVVEGE